MYPVLYGTTVVCVFVHGILVHVDIRFSAAISSGRKGFMKKPKWHQTVNRESKKIPSTYKINQTLKRYHAVNKLKLDFFNTVPRDLKKIPVWYQKILSGSTVTF